jgi:Spy/CpxP family protein refolding chaperone
MYIRRLTMILAAMLPILAAVLPVMPTTALAQKFVFAGPGGGPPPMPLPPMPLLMIIRHANLTPDQQKKVHEIMGSSFAQAQPLMKQLHDIHDQIADKLMSTGSVSASDIEPLQQQENQIHQQLDEQMLSAALQIRGLLTPEQLTKAADLHNKLKSLRQQMDALMGDNGPVMIMGAAPLPGL